MATETSCTRPASSRLLGHVMPENLVVFVFDNGCYESTGGQLSVTARGADIEKVAQAFGLKKTQTVSTLSEFKVAASVALCCSRFHFRAAKSDRDPRYRRALARGLLRLIFFNRLGMVLHNDFCAALSLVLGLPAHVSKLFRPL